MDSTVPLNRRRDKPQLSCTRCRQKKLRCDRQQPCQTCKARGLGPYCTYPPRTTPSPRALPSRPRSHRPLSQSSLAHRIDRLEDSLSALLHTVGNNVTAQQDPRASNRPIEPASFAPTPPESGTLHCHPEGTVYASSAHWTSIFDSIADLRECVAWEDPDRDASGLHEHSEPSRLSDAEPLRTGAVHLLSGSSVSVTKAEVLRAMPERFVVDRQVFWYLNRMQLVLLHTPSFLRQYESFWADPSGTPILWVSILYSILCMASLVRDAPAPPSGETAQGLTGEITPRYMGEVIQCLLLGDYSRSGPFAIEALFHYFLVEQSRRRDADARNWSLSGLILRLALRKGYHREPSMFRNITPFEGEMRRRTWMMLYYLDVVVSNQMGLPRLIKDEQCDTMLPRNLLDTDFDDDTSKIRESRPDAEITPMRWWIARSKIMFIIGQIADSALATTTSGNGVTADPCASVRQLDAELRDTYDQLPAAMKFTSLVNCLGIAPEDIANRLSLAVLLQKALTMLHRPHSGGEQKQPALDGRLHDDSGHRPPGLGCTGTCRVLSTRTCIDAALKVLEYQDLVHSESQPGGALAALGRRVHASPLSHEFLMATSVLCSFIDCASKGNTHVEEALTDRMAVVHGALARTYAIWQAQSDRSREAQRATDALRVLVGRLRVYAGGGDGNAVVAPSQQVLETPPEFLHEDLDAWFHDSFGLYGEGVSDFGHFIAW
ncbi:fungal-specific transcription factor domain-containing protein [Aspergillus germanicus]